MVVVVRPLDNRGGSTVEHGWSRLEPCPTEDPHPANRPPSGQTDAPQRMTRALLARNQTVPGSVPTVRVALREITEENAHDVLALRGTPEQDRFVSSVVDSLAEADEYPQANPWPRAVYADEQPVGFVMLSWNVEPQPPEIFGPWFLWKLLIDHRHQGKGYGREVVEQVVELVGAQGAIELLTSCVPGEGGPAGFYSRLGFVPTGELDPSGEVLLRRSIAAPSRA
jgi:diamine N-acetyltransferase